MASSVTARRGEAGLVRYGMARFGIFDMDVQPFDIPTDEISERSAAYRGELERKDYSRTPAEEEWLAEHKEFIKGLNKG
ncbi:MAG: hypothetical protein KGJ09_09660 [Candidatus Omnitrophica bacterium]|nr:hypothetical protein [Candidatus Omnitrophota bacterium]MDE2215374.1 hypothetical protein [Candidatus Omnitrophota bacterium]